jgi:hypothetical protein
MMSLYICGYPLEGVPDLAGRNRGEKERSSSQTLSKSFRHCFPIC